MHRDPAAFSEPGEFRPERFLDGPQNRARMPFGGGRRFCAGAQPPPCWRCASSSARYCTAWSPRRPIRRRRPGG
ncbi:cytochrome P450 [Nonomuraea sp. CA-141351]|uniref:cytochrome P450 n=1 Tax=Nonomuraea sp. CA-141351 TaxID=3239996 RepID=UPI003D905724